MKVEANIKLKDQQRGNESLGAVREKGRALEDE